MSTRTTRKIVKFNNPFSLEGVGRTLPAGGYEVVTDEEMIEGLSFPVYRRVATTMLAPTQSYQGSVEMLAVDPLNLAAAEDRDAAATSNKAGGVPAKVQ
jgi:hypothetical protein